jgi:hypothetical protein
MNLDKISIAEVCFGSNPTEMGHPRNVRFTPDSDRRADIAALPKSAHNGSHNSTHLNGKPLRVRFLAPNIDIIETVRSDE